MASITQFYNQNKGEGVSIRKHYSIPLKKLKCDYDSNLRPLDGEHIKRLKTAYSNGDVVPPILVAFIGDCEIPQVVDGHHRYAAAQALGLLELDCILLTKTDPASIVLAMLSSAEGKPLSQLEKAEAVRRLVNTGMSRDDVAKQLGVSKTDIENKLLLAGASIIMKGLIEAGDVSATTVIEYVRKWGDKAEEALLEDLERAAEGGAKARVSGKTTSRVAKFSNAKLITVMEIISQADYDDRKLRNKDGNIEFSLGIEDAKDLVSLIEEYLEWGNK